MSDALKDIIVACVPIVIALIGIIPTVIENRKKTQKTIEELQKENTKTLKEIQGNVGTINDDIETIRNELKGHIKEDQWNQMKQARIRIIRFADELSQDKSRFSKAHFDEVIDDIDVYEEFCSKHEDFKNNKGKSCMEFIQRTYNELMDTDGFAR